MGRIRLWSFKAKYRETRARDYRYIKDGWRIHYGEASSSVPRSDGLFPASFTEGVFGDGLVGGSGGVQDSSSEREQ